MYAARSSPNETADEPITNCSSWNQTISYIKAAQPLPANRSNKMIGTAALHFITAIGRKGVCLCTEFKPFSIASAIASAPSEPVAE